MTTRSALLRLAFILPPALLLYAAVPAQERSGTSRQQAQATSPAAKGQRAFAHDIAPLVKQFCIGCHGGGSPTAGLSLAAYADTAAVLKARDIWEKVAKNVAAGHMPPAGAPQPTQAQRDLLVGWIQSMLSQADCKLMDPGRVTIRRLNRAEYNNTIRDLLGIHFHPADDFPSDDVGYGFDNIGDVLSLSPLLMEKYLAAAEKIAEKAVALPEPRRHLFTCKPTPGHEAACARKILRDFARRAFRRPATKEEVDRLVRCVKLAQKEGASFERSIQLAVEAVLVSPNFLFRVEIDPRPNDPMARRMVNDYELASRLSYFLWSSMPDEELFALAAQGKLHDPKVLTAQARRMLKDPKAQALAENFAGQWLQLRNLANVAPDPARFPDFNDKLRAAMRTETELFFKAVMNEDRSVLDFIDARYTYLNEPLARHYGIPGVKGEQFRRVTLTDSRRGGLITQASILTVTSNPTRTSPVKRGKWVLEQLFGTPPPPPPPGVTQLADDKKGPLVGTLRQRMEQHRKDPMCASCHARMDPIGFGLENFDAVGRWRTKDGGLPVDASGTLPGGQSFNGPAQLKAILKSKKGLFVRCLSGKMLTYALGRGLEPADTCVVDTIAKTVEKNNYRFSALITAIVQSAPFRQRRGDGGP